MLGEEGICTMLTNTSRGSIPHLSPDYRSINMRSITKVRYHKGDRVQIHCWLCAKTCYLLHLTMDILKCIHR